MTQATEPSDRAKRVPRESLRFHADLFRLQGESSPDTGEDNGRAFRMVARTGGPVYHWYWGACYHDLDGMAITRDRVPIDWLHRDDEIIGYADKFSQENDDDAGDLALVASGELVPFGEADRAAEVIHKASRGVPYEASIDFGGDGIRIEELGDGVEAEVNGRTVTGPAVIFRAWPLRGIAVCPHGYDQNTRTEFSADGDDAAAISVTLFKRGSETMTKETSKPAENSTDQATDQATDRASFAAELKRYTDRFGSKGAEYFADGLDWADALDQHATALEAKLDDQAKQHASELADLQAKLDDTTTKLAAIDRGEDTPVGSTSTTEGKKGEKGLNQFIKIGEKASAA